MTFTGRNLTHIQGFDGFNFTIKANFANRHYIVDRWYSKGDIYEIGLHLIRLAGLKDEWDITENQRSNF